MMAAYDGACARLENIKYAFPGDHDPDEILVDESRARRVFH
mgnify:CR=1 FL=1